MRKLFNKYFPISFTFALSLIIITLLSGCSGHEPTSQVELPAFQRPPHHTEPITLPERPVTVSSIEITVEETTMTSSTRFFPIVTVYPENAVDTSYTLRSSDENIVRPARGAWAAFEPGRVELIATAANGVSTRVVLNVVRPVTGLRLENNNIVMGVGETVALRYTVMPPDAADRSVTFFAHHESIATVSDQGAVTAVNKGETTVDIISSCGRITTTAQITVVVPVEEITITLSRTNLAIGDRVDVEIEVYPEGAEDIEISLRVNNAHVTIADYVITAVSSGTATLTASAPNGVTASIELNVVDLAEFARDILLLTNEIRFAYNLLGFTQNNALTAAAVIRARESSTVFSHIRPDGRGPFTALDETGAVFTRAAENLAAGQTTPQQAVSGWMNSDGHRGNILHADLRQMGVAVFMTEAGRLYWVQMFTD